jgi:hypothetical protein
MVSINGVLKITTVGERRVALDPEAVASLTHADTAVLLENSDGPSENLTETQRDPLDHASALHWRLPNGRGNENRGREARVSPTGRETRFESGEIPQVRDIQ